VNVSRFDLNTDRQIVTKRRYRIETAELKTSSDGGLTWRTAKSFKSAITRTPDESIVISTVKLTADPNNVKNQILAVERIYSGDDSSPHRITLHQSTDGGISWNSTPEIPAPLKDSTNTNSRLGNIYFDLWHPAPYVTIDSRIYKPTEDLKSWSAAIASGISDLIIDPANANTLYGTTGGIIVQSIDNGITWSELNFGLPPPPRLGGFQSYWVQLDPFVVPPVLLTSAGGQFYKMLLQ
jgi:hypothetical protein